MSEWGDGTLSPSPAGAEAGSPVCAYVAQRTGTVLSKHQVLRLQAAVESRLAGRSEPTYLAFLQGPAGAHDLAELMATISVHKTDLFRDEVQLTAFDTHVLRPLAQTQRPLQVWSAGCATGEEVATLLVMLAEAGAHPSSSVLGTDISASALKEAETLSFHPDLARRVSVELRERYFRRERDRVVLEPTLRSRAWFQRHNLMDMPYPLPRVGTGFDIIFCRNVLIYFTEFAFDRVVGALADRLAPDGVLVLSAAEPILRMQPNLTTLRFQSAFFYGRRRPLLPQRTVTGELRVMDRTTSQELPAARSASGEVPAVTADGERLRRTATGEVPVRRTATGEVPAAEPPSKDASEDAERLFHLAMDAAAAGAGEDENERALRRCLYLDPNMAQARYVLAMLLEQRGQRADAIAEYRRTLATLREQKARVMGFFLNNERLRTACELAMKRLGGKP